MGHIGDDSNLGSLQAENTSSLSMGPNCFPSTHLMLPALSRAGESTRDVKMQVITLEMQRTDYHELTVPRHIVLPATAMDK